MPTARSRTFFDPEDKYIWALALDRAGNLFAATGDKGVIYKITPDGKGTRFYKTSSTNVVSLAFAPSGDLLAGTESPGRVFRIDASGKAFVLLDSPYKEIHALRLADDGTLYAAAVSGSTAVIEDRSLLPSTTDSGRAPVPTVSTEITAISVVDAGSAASAGTPVISGASRRSNRGAVYRIRPNGLWDTYWETGEDSPYDLLVEPSGSLLVGTGPEGKIFRVTGDPARATLLSRAAARQITALMREPSGRVLGATSNPGKIFALSANPAAKGSYESDVRDAGTVATWGVIRWRASAKPDRSSSCRARATPRRRTKPGARGRSRTAMLKANRSPVQTPVISSGAPPSPATACITNPHVGDSRLSATQPQARGHDHHGPSAGDGLSTSVLRQRNRDCRVRRQHIRRQDAGAKSDRPGRNASAARSAWPAHLPEGPADVRVEGRRRQRRSAAVRRCRTGAKATRRGRC